MDKEYKDKLVFGIRPIMEAIKAGKEIERLLIRKDLTGELVKELMTLVGDQKIHFQSVPVEKLNRLTRKNHQGVICFISLIAYASLENILPYIYEQGKTPLILILDRITDVRNFGAISRTAECACVDAIVIPLREMAQINADAIKTSAGALHKIPVCRSKSLKEAIRFLKNSGLQIVACTEKAASSYDEVDYRLPTAIIMGSEENGVSEECLQSSDLNVKIPLRGEIESLNVSVASGIVLFEAIRQRKFKRE
ncbi:MAG: 23S rRNA (guanosine(2251)-2'-O)-methyltransferase RlmB [Bacteroidota bacterium]